MVSGGERLSRESAEALRLTLYPPGSFVFPKRGGAIATNKKRVLQFPAALDLNTMVVDFHHAIREYAWLWLQRLDLATLSDGSNVPQLNHPDIADLPFPLPPLEEQSLIIATAKTSLDSGGITGTEVRRSLTRARALRRSILKAAFQGKLVPQDPTEEPASELLKRIKAEREAAGNGGSGKRKKGR